MHELLQTVATSFVLRPVIFRVCLFVLGLAFATESWLGEFYCRLSRCGDSLGVMADAFCTLPVLQQFHLLTCAMDFAPIEWTCTARSV